MPKDKGRGGMKRNRSESEWSGLGIPSAYDPVVESMLLECEVDRQCLSEEPFLSLKEGAKDSAVKAWMGD